MDENDTQHSKSGDDAELSKSFDENSFIGKMKFGVSKILPNSFSKWLSPKVDGTNNGRRRRHAEIDSDESDSSRNASPITSTQKSSTNANRNNNYESSQSLVPPTKKQRTSSAFVSQNTFSSYSPAIQSLGERNSIVSSTLIEDVEIPQRVNRCIPSLENGQYTPVREDRELDEGSSSQSRDKSTNPFTVNNDSSVVNFSAHLQRAKSLFTNQSYINQRLKNYRMRNPRSSLYRSTSSLCDNNSISSNASSAMSSPFYSGQTTFGGASATSRRLNSSMHTDMQSQMVHRPKVPTNLVASKSTSSLNSNNGSASMSTTAKRILDVMNKYNTPLTEVRRISNDLPSISETSVLGKRKSLLNELNMSSTGSEFDKSKRALLKPNTPYNRPFGRNAVDSIPTTELHVPTMPELLQLKKFATSTMQIREIANKPENALNKPTTNQSNEIKSAKVTKVSKPIDGDLDVSNNNKKVTNNNMEIATKQQHKNKIRSSLTKRKMGKSDADGVMPVPVDLPNVTLQMDKKTEVKFSEPFMFQPKAASTNNGVSVPFTFKTSKTIATEPISFAAKPKEPQTNGGTISTPIVKIDSNSAVKVASIQPTVSTGSSAKFSFDLGTKAQPTPSFTSPMNTLANRYKFSEPITVATSMISMNNAITNSIFTFSEPLFINGPSKTIEPTPVARLATVDSGIFSAAPSFDSANKSSGFTTPKSMFGSKKEPADEKAVAVFSAPTQPSPCDAFKTISNKQNGGKWTCDVCFVSNDLSLAKCVCCQAGNPKKAASTSAAPKIETPMNKPAVDDGFKSLIAKQKQDKWECQSCFASNNKSDVKCVCCGESQPGASTNLPLGTPQKLFSFGALTTPTSATTAKTGMDDTFKSIVAKQKSSSWECSGCFTKNDSSKSKCVCCEQRRDSTTDAPASDASTVKPVTSQFSFGSKPLTANLTGQFSFGSLPKASESTAIVAVKTTPTSQFSLGNSVKATETSSTPANKSDNSSEGTKTFGGLTNSTSAGFTFGSTSTSVSAPKTDDKLKSATADGDLFKKIVAEQTAKWECNECMVKNDASSVKCVACESPKPGSSSGDSSKKDEAAAKPSFVFGSTIGSSNTFTFGSKPEKKEEKTATEAVFGSTAFSSASMASFQFGSSSQSTASTTSNSFGIKSSSSAFTTPTTKPTDTFGTVVNEADKKPSFQFAFGSPLPAASESKDVTDTGIKSTDASKAKVLDNILVKPNTNGPTTEAPKGLFTFGQSAVTSAVFEPVKSLKRPNDDFQTDNAKIAATTPTFVFGKPDTKPPTNLFGSPAPIASPNVQTPLEAPKAFAFGSPSTNTFSAPQPSFSFGSNSTPAPAATSAPSLATPSVFGSSSFGTPSNSFGAPSNTFGSTQGTTNAFGTPAVPTLGGFKANNTFSSNPAPAFGAPSPPSEPSQQPPIAQPGLFQFGSSSDNTSSPFSAGETPKLGGFNFTPNATPSFNFSQQVVSIQDMS